MFILQGDDQTHEVEGSFSAQGWFHPSNGEIDFVSFEVRAS